MGSIPTFGTEIASRAPRCRGTVSGTNRDPDDWFAPEDPPQRERGRDRRARPPDDEDWLEDRPAARARAQGEDALAFVKAHARAFGAAGLVILVIIILIAAGAFGGGGAKPTPTTTTTSPATTTAPTTAPKPVVPAAPTTTLAPGSQGPQVRALQRALRALGFYTGPIDGGYGPKTQQAVSAFQRSVGLTADGVLGPATLKRLRAAG